MNVDNNKDKLNLIFPNEEYKEQVIEYHEEFRQNGEDVINGSGNLEKFDDFDKWLEKIRNDVMIEITEEKVPATVYLAIREKDNKLMGMVQIRHKLNVKLLNKGGNIGYSVRPSERNKGIAKEILRQTIEICKGMNIDKVLLTCDKENTISPKVMIANGAIFECERLYEGKPYLKYWINIK